MSIDLDGKGERIKEVSLPVSEAEWMNEFWTDEPPRPNDNVWALYLRLPDRNIVLRYFFSEHLVEIPAGGFLCYLRRLQSRNLKDLMYALATYNPCIRMLESGSYPELKRLEGAVGSAIEEILAETHGVLLWHHQLEQIIGFFVRDYAEVIDLRKGSNAKRPETLERLRHMEVEKGISLHDVMKSRYFNTTSICTTHEAFLLYQALES